MAKVFAILGDIHANVDALAAVLEDCRANGVTDFVCVGDVVGYNACPSECIRIVRDELHAPVVRGNHDHYVSTDSPLSDFTELAAEVVKWTRRQLSAEEIEWLRGLPYSKLHMGFTVVHSTLDMPEHWGYIFDNLTAEASFAYQKTGICFYGHSHVPMVHQKSAAGIVRLEPGEIPVPIGSRFLINVGSVGQPRDGDPRASYAIYDTKARVVKFRRLEYDVEAAMGRVRAAGLPERLAQRLAVGR